VHVDLGMRVVACLSSVEGFEMADALGACLDLF
jgi:hypothetical protein